MGVRASERKLSPATGIALLILLLVGLVLRLMNISQPFVEEHWSWRQSDMGMIAENFYRHGYNIFYPQINWVGSAPGYVGTEFPLIPFIAALLYPLLGVHDWIGRAVSVVFFTVSLPFFYLLMRKISHQSSALLAAGIYVLAPLNILASRSFMPDIASLSLSIMALYIFTEWLDHSPNSKLFIGSIVATSLGILIKLPAILIGVPLLAMVMEKHGLRFLLRRDLWIFAVLSLAIPFVWYSHAYFISLSYEPYHFFGEGGLGIYGLEYYINEIILRTIFPGLTPIVFVTMIISIPLPVRATFGRMFHWWLLALVFFIFIAGPGNWHPWYQLPMVPVAAALTGLGFDFVLKKIPGLLTLKLSFFLCLICFAVIGNFSYASENSFFRTWGLPLWKAGNEINRIAPPSALIAVVDNGNPTVIYYSKRRGWHFSQGGLSRRRGPWTWPPRDSGQAIHELEELRRKGANYLIFTTYTFWWLDYYQHFREYLDVKYYRISSTEEYIIYNVTFERKNRGVADAMHLGQGEN